MQAVKDTKGCRLRQGKSWMGQVEDSMRSTIFLERTREGHRQSDEHWNRSKCNVGETSERRDGAHVDFSERIDTILN